MACKSCTKKMATVAGRKTKRRRKGSRINGPMKGATGIITTVGGGLAGVVVAKKVNSIGFVAANPLFKIVAPVVGAIATKSLLKGGVGEAIANGMFIEAGTEAVKQFLPQVATSVGISGATPYATYLTPGVAGNGNGGNQQGVFI